MEKDRYDEGVPSWIDLSTPDPAGAAEFYAGLLGWEAPEGPQEFGGYRVCTLQGRTVAGIGPQMAPGPPVWTTYVNTASVDGTLERASAAGGKVLAGPMDVGEEGRLAVLSDPSGAVIGLWQPGRHTGAGLVNEVGTWCWSELVTTELDEARRFYPAVFGWGAKPTPPDGPVEYLEWTVGGESIAGMLPTPPSVPPGTPPFWSVYFTVADADAALARVKDLGGSVLVEPMDIDIGRFAVATDPAGAMFNVIAMTAAG